MAARTWSRVEPTTLGWPLETRETVWEETPARRATSAMDTRCLRRPPTGATGGVSGPGSPSPEADETIVGRSFGGRFGGAEAKGAGVGTALSDP
ncbi:hypothetical protein GCM10029978_082930 [Actinoallomurus acanthiterrae]